MSHSVDGEGQSAAPMMATSAIRNWDYVARGTRALVAGGGAVRQ